MPERRCRRFLGCRSDPLTNESVFDLREKPESLAILGAGAIGCELAQVFARLGVRVELFELAPRILPNESELASTTVAQALTEAGVRIHAGHAVSEIKGRGQVITDQGAIECARVLVALGRQPNTDGMKLSDAKVEVDQRGFIVTDSKLRTTNKKIFAAGDCTAALQFTHHADAQARVLVQNALFPATAKVDGLVVPHCTYTQPEVASVGASAEQLRATGTDYDEYEYYFDELDRTKAMPFADSVPRAAKGHVAVLTAKGKDTILGATVIGDDAGEMLAPLCLMMTQKLGLSAAQSTIFSYPTRSEYLKRLGDAYNRSRMTPSVAKLFARWLKFTQPKAKAIGEAHAINSYCNNPTSSALWLRRYRRAKTKNTGHGQCLSHDGALSGTGSGQNLGLRWFCHYRGRRNRLTAHH